jgi:glycosyltransferase involved in cell wall biosynthesis
MVGPDKDGSLHAVTSTARELGLSDRLRITGGLSKKDWTALSVDYDFFINTTNYDNMPVSVVEAMALGMIVISTNVGGLPRIIEHGVNGILVEPDNHIQFASWIRKIVENPTLAESLSHGARKTAEQFDWTRIEPKWTSLIDSVRE